VHRNEKYVFNRAQIMWENGKPTSQEEACGLRQGTMIPSSQLNHVVMLSS